MKKNILLVIALLLSHLAFAQQTITGIVTNADSEPIVGATVLIKGSTAGTTTDKKGTFSIQANKGDVLQFSFIGMINSDIEVKSAKNINVQMISDVYSLDDVVVIGYGTSKKSDLTGSVTTIKPDNIKSNKIGLVSNALQGMAAGVQVTQGNMKPGADAGIVIRGVGSIGAGTSPLFVIDGLPMEGGLQDLSSGDIASIEVLKDASSASIYGSRGSNGVILVTTKKGSSDRTRISFNATGGGRPCSTNRT